MKKQSLLKHVRLAQSLKDCGKQHKQQEQNFLFDRCRLWVHMKCNSIFIKMEANVTLCFVADSGQSIGCEEMGK